MDPPRRPLRLAFLGSAEFSVPTLEALIAAGHHVACVYSQPPRPAGRGHRVQVSPVHAVADRHGIPVRTPVSLKPAEEQQRFAALDLDAAVVAAYGLLLPAAVLDAPRLGCLNVHASLLPRWRGAAPIQRAIEAGDAETGVTIMQVDVGLDTGAMLAVARVPITRDTTAATLHDQLAREGARLMVEVLDAAAAGTLRPQAQPDTGVTYASKLSRDEGKLDWSRPAEELERKIRALNPWPGVWFEHGGERIQVLSGEVFQADAVAGTVVDDALGIACGEGGLRLTTVKRAGRRPLDAGSFLRGFPLPRGTRLG